MTIFKNVSKNITDKMTHLDYACGPGTFIEIYKCKINWS